LAASLWTQAQQLAHTSLAVFRSEAQANIAEARAVEDAAKQRIELTSVELARAQQSLETADARMRSVEQTLSAETATRVAIEQQLQIARETATAAQQATDVARREFAAELEKLRAAAPLSEERSQAVEQRGQFELDRERTAAAWLQKDLEAIREASAAAEARHRAEVEILQALVGDLRQRAGVLEGNVEAMKSSQDKLATTLSEARVRLEHAQAQVTTLTLDRDNWQRSAAEATQTVDELRHELESRPKGKSTRLNSRSKANPKG
jgi:chromosome segregation ATPase